MEPHPSVELTAEYQTHLLALRSALPLRLELDTLARVLASIGTETRNCLDVGFSNPLMSRALRKSGGYWCSAVWTAAEQQDAAAILHEELATVGAGGELPFDDKQFDVVVIAAGRLTGDRVLDEALVHEAHRVLRTPGYLVLGADYRKSAGLAYPIARMASQRNRVGYADSQIFELLKTGFDVLGMRTYCRFWVQVVRALFDRPGGNQGLARLLYRLAFQLDLMIFFTRGYQVAVYGRRKGWRPRQTPVLSDGRSISEAVLRPVG